MKKYDFRNQRFTAVPRLSPTGNPVAPGGPTIDEGWEIVLPRTGERLARYFSTDLLHFFNDAFGLSLRLREVTDMEAALSDPYHKIFLLTAEEADAPLTSHQEGAFYLTVTEDTVTVVGNTLRGTARGVYYLEDEMRLTGLSTLAPEASEHAPLFSPRMTHSGTELDTFPDEYLGAIAHAGMDAIIVYAVSPVAHLHGFPDPDALWPGTPRGYCDFRNLVWRAQGFGLDVYIYSQMVCDRHPDDSDAYEYYDASFGRIFREAPGLRGLILVGESFEFPSKDPRTSGTSIKRRPKGETRPSSGRFPSADYPEMLSLVRDVVRAYTPDADIVFWSYNFGWTPREARLSLIDTLPTDITYLVTLEVWEKLRDEKGRQYSVADYSISFPGPATVFLEEAERAHARGLRLYTMSNTGGRTWDTGGAPYIPAPWQWIRRYEVLREMKERYGLSGLMESHHYGWLPNPIDFLSRRAFTTGCPSDSETLSAIVRRDFGAAAGVAEAAFRKLSEGMATVIPSVYDQYGSFRVGPGYPLLFTQTAAELSIPSTEFTWHRPGGIWKPVYPVDVFSEIDGVLLRFERVSRAAALLTEGTALLAEAAAAISAEWGSDPSRQVAVARFLACSHVTAKHAMAWHIARTLLFALREGREIPRADELFGAIGVADRTEEALADKLRALAERERENVREAIPTWQEDSSIGYEPSMEYVCDDEVVAWKLSELDRSLTLLDDYMNAGRRSV